MIKLRKNNKSYKIELKENRDVQNRDVKTINYFFTFSKFFLLLLPCNSKRLKNEIKKQSFIIAISFAI